MSARDLASIWEPHGDSCFIIAEAGINHNGSIERALEMVDAAAGSGADAIKFQTYDVDRLLTTNAPKAEYQVRATGDGDTQYEMLKAVQLSRNDHVQIMDRCAKRSLRFLSTPFDESSADLLADLGVDAFKTPSGEITNLRYLAHIAAFGRPMIVSTGMATLGEVEEAVTRIQAAGAPPLALLHCVSNYPASPESVNLRAMDTMRSAFDVPVGYSDHTFGLEIGFAAVARGAAIIEKHFTLSRSLPGPDHQASLEPNELTAFVQGIRAVTASLGDGIKRPKESERATALVARKSVVTIRNVQAGERLAADDVRILRPGTGLSPKYHDRVIGRTARVDIPAGTAIQWEMLA